MSQFDLLVVAGRRPELIDRTFSSVSENFDLEFSNVFVNLDPWGSNESDHKKSKETILRYYPNAYINEPSVPNFCRAVKYLWSCVESNYAVHIEDDWIWNQKFTEQDLMNEINNVGMSRFITKENKGIDFYGTSPCVITKEFATEVSSILDIDYDPEKQYTFNTSLKNIVKNRKVKCMSSRGISAVDIGRDWRESKGIIKTRINNKSVWTKE